MPRLPALVLACLLAVLTPAVAKTNVVVILADDLGYSDLGCYGSEIRTPNLDGLAAGGLRFTQFYNTARCWPSRAALLTGYYAQAVRRDQVPGANFRGGQGTRQDWARLLPTRLAAAGYHSYHSGKWHIDGLPTANGFEHSYSLDDHDRYFYPKKATRDGAPLPPVAKDAGYYATVAVADHAIECLKEHATKHPGEPFFSYVAFTAPHFPLQALPEDIAKYRGVYDAGWEAVRQARYERQRALGLVTSPLSAVEPEVGPPYAFPDAIRRLGPNELNRPVPWASLTPEQRAFQAAKMSVHAAMVDRMDQEIGRILAQLRAMKVLDDTLLLFLSDNGASAEMMVRGDGHDPAAPAGSPATFLSLGPGWSTVANTPNRRHKTWVHEGGISTSFIAHWPKGIAARGELRTAPGHVIDVVPTVLELAQAAPLPTDAKAPAFPGHSLLPLLTQNRAPERVSLWWLHEGNAALRVGDWKIVRAKDEPWSLYDLSSDRTEQHDLAAAQPARVAELAREWERQTEAYYALALKDQPAEPAPGGKKKVAK